MHTSNHLKVLMDVSLLEFFLDFKPYFVVSDVNELHSCFDFMRGLTKPWYIPTILIYDLVVMHQLLQVVTNNMPTKQNHWGDL